MAPRRRIVSRSTRATRAAGKRARARRPRAARCRSPTARDTRRRRRRTCAAPRPRSCSSGSARAGPRGETSATTLQCGHSIDAPHCRQKMTVANPRRLSSTTICSRLASRSSIAALSGALSVTSGAAARRTPSACRRCAPSRADDSSTRCVSCTSVVPARPRVGRRLERRRRRCRARRARCSMRAAHDRDVAAVIPRRLVLLVRRRRAPRRRRSGRAVRAARTRPTACRRRRRRRRGGCGATDRAARRPRARCAGSPRARRSARGTCPPTAGVSAISGTSTSTRRPAAMTCARQTQIQLGLAAAGDAVQQDRAEQPGRRRFFQMSKRRCLLGRERVLRAPASRRASNARPRPSSRPRRTDRARRRRRGDARAPSVASDRTVRGADARRSELRQRQPAGLVAQQRERLALLAARAAPASRAPAHGLGDAARCGTTSRRPRAPTAASRSPARRPGPHA